jgi:hypothetical protein
VQAKPSRAILRQTKSTAQENDHQESSFGHGNQWDMEMPKTMSFGQIFLPHNEELNSFTHTSEPKANRAQEQNEIKTRTSGKKKAESRTKQWDTRTGAEEKASDPAPATQTRAEVLPQLSQRTESTLSCDSRICTKKSRDGSSQPRSRSGYDDRCLQQKSKPGAANKTNSGGMDRRDRKSFGALGTADENPG